MTGPERGASMAGVRVIWSSERSVHLLPACEDAGAAVGRVAHAVRAAGLEGVADVVPASTTVAVLLDRCVEDPEALVSRLADLARDAAAGAGPAPGASREIEIPVCYDAAFGPDLAGLAAEAGIGVEEAVALHTGGAYTVRFVGFSPGFGYLEGLPERLHAPRLETPRTRVPAGSVGIAGARTGVYPRATPGGWRIIGATPRVMFDPAWAEPSVLRAGDRVRFRAIGRDEFEALAGGGG